MNRPKTTRGATLIEVLVVIVIFLVGILGVAQIFPRGLGILQSTKDTSVATELGKSEMERVKARGAQLAEAIAPAIFDTVTGTYLLRLDTPAKELVPPGASIAADGTLSINGTPLGNWQRFVGSNINRKVMGEGSPLPPPRVLTTSSGPAFGSVLTLTFGPIIASLDSGTGLTNGISVYGNDLNRQYLDDDMGGPPRRFADYTAYITEGTEIYLPQSATRPRHYRIIATYTATDGSSQTVVVPDVVVPNSATPGLWLYNIVAAAPNAQYLQFDTVRVQRLFEQLPTAAGFISQAAIGSSTSVLDDAAYQFVVVDRNIGILLFNPAAYNYKELRGRGRTPLTARVDYDVFDWRILREDFRIPAEASRAEHRLAIQQVKVRNNMDVDGNRYLGIGITPLGVTSPDLVILDTDTGAVVGDDAYKVDKSLGRIMFNSYAATLYYPDGATEAVTDIRGRSLRALYMGLKGISVQVIKPAANYIPISSSTLGYQQCYIGGTDLAANGEVQNIYFPLSDVGKRVIVGEIWYDSPSGRKHLEDQEFEIRAPRGALNLAFIDIREKDSTATNIVNFATTGLQPVKRVRGASVAVRVLWNPASVKFGTDAAANMRKLDEYLRNTRRLDTENILIRGVTQ